MELKSLEKNDFNFQVELAVRLEDIYGFKKKSFANYHLLPFAKILFFTTLKVQS